MPEPRRNQRFPGGGKDLYELLRSDYEPLAITVFPTGEVSKERAAQADTLTYEPAFDPMLYFWPVHRQWVLVFMKTASNDESVERLAKAMMRDGAEAVTVIWPRARTQEERAEFGRDWISCPHWRTFGDLQKHLERLGHAGAVATPT